MINDQCNGSQVPIFFKRRNISTLILQQRISIIIINIIITRNLFTRSKSQLYRRIRGAVILKFWSDIFTPLITNVHSSSLICNTEYSSSIKNCKSQACNENLSHASILIKRQNISTCILKQISLFLSENITQSISEALYTLWSKYFYGVHLIYRPEACVLIIISMLPVPSTPNYRAHLVYAVCA